MRCPSTCSRLSVGGHPGVVQPRDVRVLERGENLAFPRQPGGPRRPAPGAVRQLQRDLAALQQVGTLSQPHAGHAAFADLAQQAIGAHVLPRLLRTFTVGGCRYGEIGGLDLGQRSQQLLLRAVRMREQGAQPRLERQVLPAERVEPGAARCGRKGQCIVEQAAKGRPLVGRKLEVALHRVAPMGYFKDSARNSRACSQSRRTVRSVTPSASPISASVSPPK